MISAAAVVDRARSQVGRKTRYALGRGGFKPDATYASDALGRCDCSGFVSWCICEPRQVKLSIYKQYLGNWIETSAIVRDARLPGVGLFDEVPVLAANPGMIYVWGDKGKGQGHCGIITEVDESGPTRIVHCSKGNFNKMGDAIQETGVELFEANGAIVARCIVVDHGDAVGLALRASGRDA